MPTLCVLNARAVTVVRKLWHLLWSVWQVSNILVFLSLVVPQPPALRRTSSSTARRAGRCTAPCPSRPRWPRRALLTRRAYPRPAQCRACAPPCPGCLASLSHAPMKHRAMRAHIVGPSLQHIALPPRTHLLSPGFKRFCIASELLWGFHWCISDARPVHQGSQSWQSNGASAEPPSEPVRGADAEPKIILDWKGDPMVINPNDNMPFF